MTTSHEFDLNTTSALANPYPCTITHLNARKYMLDSDTKRASSVIFAVTKQYQTLRDFRGGKPGRVQDKFTESLRKVQW